MTACVYAYLYWFRYMTMFNQTEPEFWPFLIRFLPSQVFCLEAESMTRLLLFVYVSIQMEPKFCCFLAIFTLSAPSCRHWPLFWYFSSFILGDESMTRLLLVYMSIQMEPEFCCFLAILLFFCHFLIFFIFYFRRWIYDHVNTGIIGLYVHVHSNGTRTFPRDVKVPSIYYVSTFSGILDPLTVCWNKVLHGHILGIKM